MQFELNVMPGARRMMLLGALCFSAGLFAQVPVVTQTNTTIRVMASNLTTGNNQRYETPGLNILKGLKPDIVAMQEFNCSNRFGINTPAALREMLDSTFGTNFVYSRETNAGYTIPNGIISRYPIITNGSWDDVQLPDRGFAWARIDLPGTNDLYVVSVHLHSSGGASSRAIEATNLTVLIQANFPANAWIILAGDFNTASRNEAAVLKFKTFLSDSPIPTDAESGGDPDTNGGRTNPYDYILPSFSFTNALTNVVLTSHSFSNGLVFDSRVYTPLSDVPPVTSTDSAAPNMQHVGVVKDFKITYVVTNVVTVPPPQLVIDSASVIHWQGVSNVVYTVQSKINLAATNWFTLGKATSTTGNFSFTNSSTDALQLFYRVTFP